MSFSPSSSINGIYREELSPWENFNMAMDAQGFVAHRVLPYLEVGAQSGSFFKFVAKELVKGGDGEDVRHEGGYKRFDMRYTDDSFNTKDHGVEIPVGNRMTAICRNYFEMEQVAAREALLAILRNQERRVADAIFNATTWSGATLTTAVTNEWDDFANATPIADVMAAKDHINLATGLKANALICNQKVFDNLVQCAQVVDRVKYQDFHDVSMGSFGVNAVAQMLNLQHILVAGGVYNSANDGQAFSASRLWSDEYAMVARIAVPDEPNGEIAKVAPSLGRILHWGEDGSQAGGVIESYGDSPTRATIIRARMDTQEKITLVEAGHLLSNITAP